MFKTYSTDNIKITNFVKDYIYLDDKTKEEMFDDYYYYEKVNHVNELISNNKELITYEKEGVVIAVFKIVSSIDEYFKSDEIITNQFEGIILGLHYKSEYENLLLKELSLYYPNHLLIYDDNMHYSNLDKNYEILKVDLESDNTKNYIEKNEFIFKSDYLISNNTTINKETLTQCVMNLYKDISFDKYEVRSYHMNNKKDKEELKKLFDNEVLCYIPGSQSKYYGFHYVSSDLFSYRYNNEQNLIYFVVVGINQSTEKPLSVLKINDYALSETKNYIGLNYINTNRFFFKKGLTKLLYQALNKHILSLKTENGDKIIFISSSLSDMGEKASIDKTRLTYLTANNCLQFNNHNEYNLYLYEQKTRAI